MSRYEWEAGTVKIPTRAWAQLKKSLRQSHNLNRERILDRAEGVQRRLHGELKGKRNITRVDVARAIERALANCPEDCYEQVESLVMASLKQSSDWRTKKITQAMLDKHVGQKATTKTSAYGGDEWTIMLNDTACTVHWSVGENNHAVERARESVMGHALFRLLSKIDYGTRRKMGGEIVGNDELNRDDNEADGGANYVTARFGKAGHLDADRGVLACRFGRFA